MSAKIETWFPKSIYIHDDFSKDLLIELEKEIKFFKRKKRDTSLFVDSTHKTDRKLHLQGTFKHLSDNILKEVKNFVAHLGYGSTVVDQIYMSSMWVNTSKQGDFIFPHNHAGGFISGAYYVKSIDENSIIFYDNLNDVYMPSCNPNQLSYNHTSYKCIPARLLMWRSNFVHGTPIQLNKGEKIVISFNCALETNQDSIF